jgi:hypothetical protein
MFEEITPIHTVVHVLKQHTGAEARLEWESTCLENTKP